MTEDKGRIFVEYTVVAGSYNIYYGDVILGCRVDYLTKKTIYNYVMYLFIYSSS